MKYPNLNLETVILLAGLSVLGACTNKALSLEDRSLLDSDGGTASGGTDRTFGIPTPPNLPTPTDPILPTDPTAPTLPPVCDPFETGGSSGQNQNGLKGILSYLPPEEWSSAHSISAFWTIDPATSQVVPRHAISADIFLSQLNTPTRAFSRGFYLDNDAQHAITYPNSTDVLQEYFALHLKSKIKLAHARPGYYEFAVLADDGATLKISDSKGVDRMLVNNDGIHAELLRCSAQGDFVHIDEHSSLPITVDYFQGPRYHISLMLLWRHVDDSDATAQREQDQECTKNGSYFDSSTAPSIPKPAYNNFLGRGWEVVPAENFELPNNEVNPCM